MWLDVKCLLIEGNLNLIENKFSREKYGYISKIIIRNMDIWFYK